MAHPAPYWSDCCARSDRDHPAAKTQVAIQRPPCSYWNSRKRWNRGEPKPLVVLTMPPLIRTHRMLYWHRPRWAVIEPKRGLQIARWCQATEPMEAYDRRGRPLLTADYIAIGQTLCRRCEANAVDAGLPPTAVDPYMVVPLRSVAS